MADSKKYNQRVPSEYQEIEYLESNGTQYIDTNIIPTNSAQTKVQFEFQLTDVTNGMHQSIGCNSNMNFTSSQTLLKFRSNAIEIANFDTAWHICEMSKSTSGKLTIFDGEEYRTSTTTEAALHFLLFGMALDNGMYYGRYKLKYFKCYENNTLVRNMIPVRRISDNVLGMYDIVNNVFYTNQGTGSFAAGSDVNNWLHSLRKLTTATDTLTTLPADVYADGTNATVGLKGNMVQSGTPSPTTPIQPSETGERTGNLWNEEYPDISGTIRYIPLYVGEGSFTLSTTVPYDSSVANVFLLRGNVTAGASTPGNGAWLNHNVTARSDGGYITIAYRNYTGTTSPADCKTMLNTGSTPLPYEPYGIKIPISSANTTTPVYLGEVQTTRKIRKWVLTGEETSWHDSNGFIYNDIIQPNYLRSTAITLICSHYKAIGGVDEGSRVSNGQCALYRFTGAQRLYIRDNNYATADDFKSYLTAQYAAGTPVTIWYVLANETTGIVNEPLRKIGDYADTVSGITIPTIAGADTFDVLTTLKPSEVSLSYTGWHDATVKEWDGSEWQ